MLFLFQQNYLSTLDNFIADFFFDVNFSSVQSYFVPPKLSITQSVIKNFTQPYGYNRTDPLNFTKYEEYSFYSGTNIVSSKEFLNHILIIIPKTLMPAVTITPILMVMLSSKFLILVL